MYGIEKLKEAILKVVKTSMEIEDKLKDGFSFFEIVGLVPNLWGLRVIWTDRDQLMKELYDLNDQEKQEIYDFIADELDLQNNKMEAIIEQSFAIIFAAGTVYEEVIVLIDIIKGAKED